ncbi:MAG: RIP metalloprotease RseP [Brevinematia bacterium]
MTIISILLGILFLGIIVLVHEIGHFLVARWRKVDVEVFSIGMGPKICGKKIGNVDFRISAIPFGGYVKMKGDSPSDLNLASENTFYGTKPINRILISLAGPFFNYLFAVILISAILMIGFKSVGVLPRIYIDTSKGINYFALAGVKSGDIVKKINGKEVKTFQEINAVLVYKMDQNVEITFLRGEKEFTTKVYIPKNYINNEGGLGISFAARPVIGSLTKGFPAEKVGLREGDEVVSVNGKKVQFFNELSEIIYESGGKELTIVVKRENSKLTFKVTPEFDKKSKRYVIGISPKVFEDEIVVSERKEGNPIIAFAEGFLLANEKLVEVIKGMQLLLSGKIDFQSSIAGPIRITYFLSSAIENQIAIQNILIIVAIISMAIGIFNLIPFPGLDGWHIVLSSFEAIIRRKPSPSVITVIETIGFIAIVTLIIFILFNDIFNLLVRDLKLLR